MRKAHGALRKDSNLARSKGGPWCTKCRRVVEHSVLSLVLWVRQLVQELAILDKIKGLERKILCCLEVLALLQGRKG